MSKLKTSPKELLRQNPISNRTLAIDTIRANTDDIPEGTLEFSFSSELPVERWWYQEILEHTKAAANLDRCNDGAALLFNHDRDQLLGVIEKAWLSDKKAYCRVRFDLEDNAAADRYRQIQEGFLKNVSFAYAIQDYREEKKDNVEYLIATRWEVLEISIVTVPADPTVGIGRTLSYYSIVDTTRDKGMSTDNPVIDLEKETATVVRNERERIADIQAISDEYELPKDHVQKALRDGWSVEKFRGESLEILAERVKLAEKQAQEKAEYFEKSFAEGKKVDPAPPVIGMEKKERQRYSLLKVLRSLNAEGRTNEDLGFEKEIDTEMRRLYKEQGILPAEDNSFIVPTRDILPPLAGDFERQRQQLERFWSTTQAGLGQEFVFTSWGDLIDLYRNTSVMLSMGPTVLTGLVGDLEWPAITSDSTVYWLANQTADLTESDVGTGKLPKITPKNMGILLRATRQMLMQSSFDVEAIFRQNMIIQQGLGIDNAMLRGTGATGQPRGLMNTAGVLTMALGANGGSPTYDTIVDAETRLKMNNIPGEYRWLTSPQGLNALRKIKDSTGQPLNWWDSSTDIMTQTMSRRIDGYSITDSNQVPANLTKGTGTNLTALIFGYWSNMVYAEWGGLELMADPYTYFKSGQVQYRAFKTCDVTVLRPKSFLLITDAIHNVV